jgi:hypothetical protein
VEQQPRTVQPIFLEPPPPPPTPQKTIGVGISRVPSPPDPLPLGALHGLQWLFLAFIALNLFMSIIITLVSGTIIPLLFALLGVIIPIIGYAIEQRFPTNIPKRFNIARQVLGFELAFFIAWEFGMGLFWPR